MLAKYRSYLNKCTKFCLRSWRIAYRAVLRVWFCVWIATRPIGICATSASAPHSAGGLGRNVPRAWTCAILENYNDKSIEYGRITSKIIASITYSVALCPYTCTFIGLRVMYFQLAIYPSIRNWVHVDNILRLHPVFNPRNYAFGIILFL